ncbi:MAG TPA: winged helix-turn-helix domain-containing protein [Pyrinomonadaceae bacterium]|jgi:DNA-binding winged helix-turn-helix (wHTH) protein/TolB-like protein
MSSQTEQHFYEFGPFRVDTLKRLLLREGQPVPLTAKAFDTLVTFVQHSGQDLDKDELMRTVWPDTVVEENNLTQNVSALRKALGENKSEHRYIVTIPGRGYRFVATVKEVCDAQTELLERAVDAETTQAGGNVVAANTLAQSPNGSTVANVYEPSKTDSNGAATTASSSPVSAPSSSLPALQPARLSASLLKRAALVVLIAGILAVVAYWWLSNRSRTAPEVVAPPGSIAVLPFKPLGMSASDDYLGLGMADALITKLSNIRQITVRPTSAVLKFAGEGKTDPVAAGRELNVDSVLEGSIQRAGDRVRVTVQLVSVRESRPLWAHSFDEQLTDIFSVQDSISAQVAQALTLKLTGEEQRLLAKRYTESVEAYQAYLRGRYFWNKRNEESLNKSIVYFNEAITRDPAYALAYAGVADAHSVIGFYQFGKLPPQESFQKAKAAALKALELDDSLAEAHASLALSVGDVDQDDVAAEREFKRAIELNPNYATAHHWYSDFLALSGRHAEAMTEIKRALELDPLSLVINATLGERLYQARQYDEAIAHLRRTLEMDSNFGPAHYLLGLALEQKGFYDEAIAELSKARTLSGSNPWMVSALGHTLALSGRKADAQRVLVELRELSKARHVTPYDFAVVYQGLGQHEQVIEWLQKLHKDKIRRALKDDPRMDALQQDQRFQKLYQS